MRSFLRKHLSDILILGGAGAILYATWLLSFVAAIYTAGGMMMVMGVVLAIGSVKAGGRK